MDRVVGKVETRGAAVPPYVTELVQLVVLGSGPELYQASAVREKLNEKSNGKIF